MGPMGNAIVTHRGCVVVVGVVSAASLRHLPVVIDERGLGEKHAGGDVRAEGLKLFPHKASLRTRSSVPRAKHLAPFHKQNKELC